MKKTTSASLQENTFSRSTRPARKTPMKNVLIVSPSKRRDYSPMVRFKLEAFRSHGSFLSSVEEYNRAIATHKYVGTLITKNQW